MHHGLPCWLIVTLFVLTWFGCDGESIEPPVEAIVATAEVSDVIPTVVTVSGMVANGTGEVRVAYGVDEALDHQRVGTLADDGSFEVLLLGLLPSRDYGWQVTAEAAGGGVVETDIGTLVTGPVPTSLPELHLSTESRGDAIDGYLVTTLIADHSVPVVIDTAGEYVWWYTEGEPSITICRARLSRDGESVLYVGYAPIDMGGSVEEGQTLVRVSLDGRDEQAFTTSGGGRDFLELDDGTVAMLSFDIRDVDGQDVNGDVIMEIGVDGGTEEVFNIWDHLDEISAISEGPGLCHANHLEYDEEQRVYHMSCRNLGAIMRIDRDTGDILGQIGGVFSDYTTPEGSTLLYANQHGFQVLDDGVLVFDNEEPPVMESQVRQYRLVDETGVAELVWDHISDPPVFVYVLGDANMLPNGDRLVTWATAGQIEQVTEDHEVVWQINTGFGAAFGYTGFRESLYMAP